MHSRTDLKCFLSCVQDHALRLLAPGEGEPCEKITIACAGVVVSWLPAGTFVSKTLLGDPVWIRATISPTVGAAGVMRLATCPITEDEIEEGSPLWDQGILTAPPAKRNDWVAAGTVYLLLDAAPRLVVYRPDEIPGEEPAEEL